MTHKYQCETCKWYDDDEGTSACNVREEWISEDIWKWIQVVGCASYSPIEGTDLPQILDITAPKAVEITIRDDGKVVWVNTENGCVLRICQIPKLDLIDETSSVKKHYGGKFR